MSVYAKEAREALKLLSRIRRYGDEQPPREAAQDEPLHTPPRGAERDGQPRRRLFSNPFFATGRAARKRRKARGRDAAAPRPDDLLLDGYPDPDRATSCRRSVAFDTWHSSVFEPIFRALLIAGLLAFILVAVFTAYKINGWLSAEPAARGAPEQPGRSLAGQAGSPERAAADLATGFGSSYLATDPSLSPQDYAARLAPYLHPDADPSLFAPASKSTATTKVLYSSVRSVKPAGGAERYRVLLDVRTLTDTPSARPPDEAGAAGGGGPSASGDTVSEDLAMTVYVRADAGGGAWVVAPPTVSEAAPAEAGSPGVFETKDAEPLTEAGLEKTLDDFFRRLYASPDLRPLVAQDLADGVTVKRFPPEGYSYDGIERAALYRVLDAEPEAAGIEFDDLFRAEVYVKTTDADGVQRTQSYVLEAGQKQNGKWLITEVK